VIKVENLVKSYQGVRALKSIHLTVETGEIYGFLGRNGAGKTTTMNILAGLSNYDSGMVEVDGTIGYLPENPFFYEYMSAVEYLNFLGELAHMDRQAVRNRTNEILKIIGLENAKGKRIASFSRGMKQRLGIGAALYTDPDVILLDEPTSALDPEGRRDIAELLNYLKGMGKTVFLSTHILSDVERLCDKVSILKEGEIILESSMKALLEKYSLPIYDLEFELPPSREFVKILESIEAIDRVEVTGNTISVHSERMDHVEKEILKRLVLAEEKLVSLSRRQSDFEDIYIRLVESNESIS